MSFKILSLRLTGLAVALAASMLAGCTPNDTTFGGAVRHNQVVQVIDPDPQGSARNRIDGEPSAAAVERYREGKVTKPQSIRTTEGNGGGGSSGGSN